MRKVQLLWCLLLLIATAAPAAAHHGITSLDANSVTVRGVVAGTEWVNPHVVLLMDARKGDGPVERWTIALSPPGAMKRKGLTGDSLKTGMVIAATGHPSKSRERTMSAVEFTLPDGRTFRTGNENFFPVGSKPQVRPDDSHQR